jgi:hypothetical protein
MHKKSQTLAYSPTKFCLSACNNFRTTRTIKLPPNADRPHVWRVTSSICSAYFNEAVTIPHSARRNEKQTESGNACCHSVQNLLSSNSLSKNIKIKVYVTVILPLFLYGCETWSVTPREKHSLRVLENRVLRRIFGPKRVELRGEWRRLHKYYLGKENRE